MSFLDQLFTQGIASALRTLTGQVDVSGSAAPAPGDVLQAIDAENAEWAAPAAGVPAALQTSTGQVAIASTTPAPGDVLQAVDATNAVWAAPAVSGLDVDITVYPLKTTLAGTEQVWIDDAATTKRAAVTSIPGIAAASWIVMRASGGDDSAAFQAALTQAAANGGATIYFPDDDYQIGGALQDVTRGNAQVLWPSIMVDTATQPVNIRLLGRQRPTGQFWVIAGSPVLPTRGTVIRGTVSAGGGAMIGGWGPVGSFGDFTGVRIEIENLTFRLPADSTKTCVDLSHCEECWIDGVRIDASANGVDLIALQTTATSYGLKLPTINNGASVELGWVNVIGFYNGVLLGEHTNAEHIVVVACRNAVEVPACYHASLINRLQALHCKVGLVWTGEHTLRVSQYNVEHGASGTWTPTYDVSDPSNFARGSLLWHTVLSGSGAVNTFLVNGALYLKRSHLYYEGLAYQLTDSATVTIDCSLAESFRWVLTGSRTFANPINPYDGQVINVRITQDATGSRVWTLGSKFKFAGGAPALSTAADARDFLSAQYDANHDTWHCSLLKAFS